MTCHWIRNCLGEARSKSRIVMGKTFAKGTFEELGVLLTVILAY